jgi:hypothetical protein
VEHRVRIQVTRHVASTLLRHPPTTPSLKDWTKLGPCLDFYVGADHQSALLYVLEDSTWAAKLADTPDVNPTDDVENVILDWSRLIGMKTKPLMRKPCGVV